MKGNMLWFCNARGYGFIIDSSGEHYFTHSSDIVSDMSDVKDGCAVNFNPVINKGRPQATNVEVI